MSCDSVAKLIPPYFYGELPPEEEDRLEEHLHGCPACAREMERQRQLAAAMDRRQIEVPPFLLEECRAGLMAAIEDDPPALELPVRKGPWTLFLEAMGATLAGFGRLRQPVGALALVAVGFFAARFTGTGPGPLQTAAVAPSDQVYSTVRSVQSDPAGRVRIAFDETRRREVYGSADDQNIQRLLLAAAHEDNAAVRVQSVDLLKNLPESTEVRDALLNALATDSNPGVRLKALDGLRPLAADVQVRKTLAQILMTDDYPAVRMQAVDLLVAHRDGSMVGVLQSLVQRDSNDYVRLKCEKALKDMNASVGTF
jgi:anti-sigma factor RsiW